MFIRIKKGGIKEAVIGRRLGQGLLCLIPVSYTHLTLPTNREV